MNRSGSPDSFGGEPTEANGDNSLRVLRTGRLKTSARDAEAAPGPHRARDHGRRVFLQRSRSRLGQLSGANPRLANARAAIAFAAASAQEDLPLVETPVKR